MNPSEHTPTSQQLLAESTISNKKREGGPEHVIKLIQYIETTDVDSLRQLLDTEKIQKGTITIGLSLAVQNFYTKEDRQEIIDILLYHGADPDSHFRYYYKTQNPDLKIDEKDNVTILMYAAFRGYRLLIDSLLKQVNNINLKDKNGKNALFYAVLSDKEDNADTVSRLIEAKIDVNCIGKVENNKKGYITHSPLSLAATNNLTNSFLLLLEGGGDPNFKTMPNEDTILHIAVRNRNVKMIKMLLDKEGLLLKEKNREGNTPSALAAKQPETEIYQMIVEKIKDVDKIINDNANELLSDKVGNKKKRESNITNNINVNIISNMNNNMNSNNNVSQCNGGSKNSSNSNNDKNIDDIQNKKNKDKTNSLASELELFLLRKAKYHHYNSNNIRKMRSKRKTSLQIPIHFKKENQNSKSSTLTSYLDLSNLNEPTLTIDLSPKALEKEAKIASLKSELEEKIFYIHQMEKEKQDYIKKQKEFDEKEKKYKEQEEKHNSDIKSLNKQINDLKKERDDLLKQHMQLKLQYLDHSKSTSTALMTEYLNKKFINFRYEQIYVFNCLTKDIIEYQQFVTDHIQIEQNVYKTLIQNVQTAVNESIPSYEVHLYGSHATNLCLPCSDLDIVLKLKVGAQAPTLPNHILLGQLFENLKQKKWIKESKFIGGATIPIIKLIAIEQFNSMSIDISIQDEKHFGLQCVDLVTSFLNSYESLKPLVLALKNILKRANLNDPYKGGMSSYGLILMIVSFLQSQKKRGKDISVNDNNLGRLFYDFLNYYGLQFDPSKYIIYARINEDDEDENNVLQNIQIANDIVIIDPLNLENNVAKSCFQFLNIKISFIICILTLKEDCECGCHYTGPGEKYNNLNIEHCFLKRIFNSVKRFLN